MARENILVIDDDHIVGIAFKAELEDRGFNVDAVLDGEAALKAVKSKNYDLVFIDLVLPDIDGVALCRKIMRTSSNVICIFMTGHVEKDLTINEADFVMAGGRVYYLYKPFGKDEIYEVTKKALLKK